MARLADTYPQLAAEIVDALGQDGETAMAEQVPSLDIILMCDCDDESCQGFYTAPKPKSTRGPNHRNLTPPTPWQGMLILDIVDERITYVEVLDRHPLN